MLLKINRHATQTNARAMQGDELTNAVVEQISWTHHHVLVLVQSLTKSSEALKQFENTGLVTLRIRKKEIF